MDKKTISTMKKMFDDIMHTTEDGTVEFWYARELKVRFSVNGDVIQKPMMQRSYLERWMLPEKTA